jgi:hypothetical protein
MSRLSCLIFMLLLRIKFLMNFLQGLKVSTYEWYNFLGLDRALPDTLWTQPPLSGVQDVGDLPKVTSLWRRDSLAQTKKNLTMEEFFFSDVSIWQNPTKGDSLINAFVEFRLQIIEFLSTVYLKKEIK